MTLLLHELEGNELLARCLRITKDVVGRKGTRDYCHKNAVLPVCVCVAERNKR